MPDPGLPDLGPLGRAVFVAIDVGATMSVDGVMHPTVVIDAAGSPEVSDLARVHALDGVGDVETMAIRSGRAVVLVIRMSSPVRAAFAVVFDLAMHRAFLGEVADNGSLTVATTDPAAAASDRPWWLSVDIDGTALRRVVEPGTTE